MTRYEVRETEPTELQRQMGVRDNVFVVWDTKWNARVGYSTYVTRGQAQYRADRLEKA